MVKHVTLVEPSAMPGSVKRLRLVLYATAGLCVLLFAVLAFVGFAAGEIGAVVGFPLLLGIAGVVLAVRIGPGRSLVRIGILVLEAVWTVVALGGIGQGDPTGIVMLILAVAALVLVNTRGARDYFSHEE